MLKTIHKSTVEKFSVDVETRNYDTSNLETFYIGIKQVDINEEQFKLCLKDNKTCHLQRETFVLEHDEENSKIIFKRYFVRKNSVPIKNTKKLNLKRLKVFKTYKSLSIDINTGEFSVYSTESAKKRKKPIQTIRKTVFTTSTQSIIDSIFDINLGYIKKDDINEGIHKALSLLGYNVSLDKLINRDIVNFSYRNHFNNKNIPNQFFIFLAINYFKKNKISVPNDYYVLEYARNLKFNKKDYFGKSVYDYYANYFDVDVSFIKDVFCYYQELNLHIYETTKNHESNKDPFAFEEQQVNYYRINGIFVTILYKLGYGINDIKTNSVIFGMLYINDAQYYFEKPTIPVDILFEHKEFFICLINDGSRNSISSDSLSDLIISTLKMVRIFRDVYNIKMNPNIIYKQTVNDILSALHDSVEKTGMYCVSNSFLNRLKKQLPKNSKCHVTKYINKTLNDTSFIGKLRENPIPCSVLIIRDKNDTLRLRVYETNIQLRAFKPIQSNSLLLKSYDRFRKNFDKNANKEKYVGLKAHYSIKVFEEHLKERCTKNDFDFIFKNLVYIT